ncbi:SDR family NAD(P)-dependent oxidoreductase [Sphingomonas immobilis]|uniref:SDR family oxidoreductase n=1 Tax=Sphingomonas immobilis TaxID=3063997 RepID=A0ABT9A3Q5_9SPHN|nr:SDR family oxidoreductase [Sphingomonas sp. CA1-15]MDO7844052.1 SDR family oxidoreductase [Sphingomonas sp. CA1-15]
MTRMTFDLTGRVALVTGAGQGVGAEIARTLAAHGAKVVVNDYVLDRAEAVVAEIVGESGVAVAVQGDVGDSDSVDTIVATGNRALGPIDILVNNAGNAGPDGAMPRVDFWETDPDDWDRYLRVNLFGVMNCARACAGGMVARGYGRIITIVSDAGRAGEQGHEAYSAGKAGAAGFSRALARSLGRYGVTANTISLSNIWRPGLEPTPEGAALLKQMLSRYIVRRQGRPSDVAPVALLLASQESEWITGQNYPVNGGYVLAL